ncbi:MAG: S49 family peptidase [Methylovirgula sp.]
MKSSPLKAEPSGYEPTSPEVRAALASLVADSFTWFKGLVKDRRGMTDAQLATVDDGRVFTGRQGIGLKLIDEVGEEREGVAWLERVKKVPTWAAGARLDRHRPVSAIWHFQQRGKNRRGFGLSRAGQCAGRHGNLCPGTIT